MLNKISSQNPNPIPLPLFDLEKAHGIWYVTSFFELGINNSVPNPITCFYFEIDSLSDNNSIQVNQTIYYHENPITVNLNYNVQTPHSVWEENSGDQSVIEWVAVDYINYEWGVIGWANLQAVEIISRNPQISPTVNSAILKVLQAENYTINSTNIWAVNNNCDDEKISKESREFL